MYVWNIYTAVKEILIEKKVMKKIVEKKNKW